MNDPRVILGEVRITEKGSLARETLNKFTFSVHKDANKIEIRKAVEQVFSVKVKDVRTMVYDGKPKRQGKYEGRRAHWKKAIVTLEQGQSIPLFEQI